MVVEGDAARIVDRAAHVAETTGRLGDTRAAGDVQGDASVGRHPRVVGETGEAGVEVDLLTFRRERQRRRAGAGRSGSVQELHSPGTA
jgi:hypothetical protein